VGEEDAAPVAAAPRGSNQPTPPLVLADARVRRVPFATNRPTFSELKRVVATLGTVFEPAPAAVAAAERRLAAGADAESALGEGAAEHGGGLSRADKALLRRRQAEEEAAARREGQDSEGEDDDEEENEQRRQPDPPLVAAARAGDAERVAALLATHEHDPAGERDWRGRTAYQVASSKEARDALRRGMARDLAELAAAEAGEGAATEGADASASTSAAPPTKGLRWDWAAACVPSPLTDDLEAVQAAKRADKKAKLKARERERKAAAGAAKEAARERELAALEAEIGAAAAEAAQLSLRASATRAAAPAAAAAAARRARAGGGGGGGGGGRSGGPQRAETADDVARRREMMAAAAEERMRRLQAAQASQQLW
jgi:hypothetical protein